MRTWMGALTAVALLAASPARAAGGDWFASVHSPDGIEIRADERLFTLYALLNAMGFDDGPVVRKAPVPKREFSPVRQQVRQALATLDPKLKEQVSAFFDAHPLPLAKYVAFVAQLDAAPTFASPAGIQPAELAGFEKLLAQTYESGHVKELFAKVQDDYRASTKAYVAQVDAAFGKARKILHDPASRPVLAVNDLDGRDAAHGVAVGGEGLAVIGPSAKANAQAAVRAWARSVLDPVVAKKAGALKGAGEQAAIVRGSGGPALEGAADYASELLARAIAIKCASADANADEKAALEQGFAGIREAVRALDGLAKDTRPLDQAVADVLAGIDLKKPAGK